LFCRVIYVRVTRRSSEWRPRARDGNTKARIRRQEVDLFGRLASVWQVVRISNGYRFLDPLERQPGRKAISPKIELDTQNRI